MHQTKAISHTIYTYLRCQLSVGDTVSNDYMLGYKDKYENVAMLLRSTILRTFKEIVPLPWPPTSELLLHDIVKFLNTVISGDADIARCEKTRRVVLSVGQACQISLCILTLTDPESCLGGAKMSL